MGSGVLLLLSLCFKLLDKLVSEDAEEFHDLFASGLFQFPNIDLARAVLGNMAYAARYLPLVVACLKLIDLDSSSVLPKPL